MKITIFIPGVGGSHIHDAQTNENFYPGRGYSQLYRYMRGKCNAEIFNRLITSKALKSPKILDSYATVGIYRDFIRLLKLRHTIIDWPTVDLVTKSNKDLAILMPWVWLYGIDHGVRVLSDLVDEIKSVFNKIVSPKIHLDGLILIGHSAGGIVANLFNFRCNENVKILRIITIGTPFFGTNKALKLLRNESQDASLPGFSVSQIMNLANQPHFKIIYDLLPCTKNVDNNTLNEHKLARANALKHEILIALQYHRHVERIHVYNIKHMLDYHKEYPDLKLKAELGYTTIAGGMNANNRNNVYNPYHQGQSLRITGNYILYLFSLNLTAQLPSFYRQLKNLFTLQVYLWRKMNQMTF